MLWLSSGGVAKIEQMVNKGYKQTKEHKNKIGLANAKILKGRICSPNGLKKIIKMSQEKRNKFGYINSPETRNKLSDIMKNKWKNKEITVSQLSNCKKIFEKGKDTQFKKGTDSYKCI